ncbi:hypothetical protein N9192_01375 [Akkermansiaceae bacterium]|nr:hypothetical protein [Akkermansiaceae bacterium]MDB4541525.1 hypothetical protein [Akkermansiaceae bacterium]
MAKQEIEDLIKSHPPMFWWMLANILAIAFAFASWVVCLNLFRDPTNETSYQLMLKVGRLDPLEAYEPSKAPRPKRTASPLELEAQYQRFKEDDLEALNHELLRSYVTNFKKAKFLTYIKGDFRIIESRALTENDFLPQGVIVRAQAMVTSERAKEPIAYPVFIECLFPSKNANPDHFPAGEMLTLTQRRKGGNPDCASVLHVSSVGYEGDRALNLTIIPLCAVDYTTPSETTINLSPPEGAGVGSPLPVF